MYRPFLRPIAISKIATSERITSEKVALVLPLERSLNVIGNDCILCGQVGIAGTVDIGSNTILAGQVGVTGHLSIGDRVIANACSGITKDVPSGEHVMGMPAVNHKRFNKSYACMLQLSKLREKIRKIEL